jgi:hypothetical protein
MNCSQARIDANRRNAQKSTGPRTVEGKLASRANALTHGLCSVVIVPESAELVQKRAEEIYEAFKPYTDYQAWQVDRAAIITVRIDRIERMERRIRDKICLRAELTWDDDRRLEAEVLGGKLSKRPAETVEMLRRTPHGCEWLMGRWALLAHAADTQKDHEWTPEQTSLAFDLLATPALFRVGKPGTSVDFHGNVLDKADESAAVARRMVDELMEHREVVRGLDDVNRSLTEADLDLDSDAELRRLRRYESTMHNRLRWTIKQLTFQGPEGKPDPFFFPKWVTNPVPELGPEPLTDDEKAARDHDPKSPHPPFCLKPEEFPSPGEKADIPEILKSRKQKREAKTRANREAERRKIEKNRA